MSDILDLLRQYKSEWENVCPDAVMKRNLRDRMFAFLDRRTPAPSSEVERAVRPYLRVVEAARLIGTAHSGYCATVHCNCVGHDKRRAELADALELLDSPIPEEKPSPLEKARSAVIEAAKDFSDFWYEEAIKSGRGSRMVDALAHLSALSVPAKGGV